MKFIKSIKRAVLFVISLTVIFGLIEPGLSLAYATSATDKIFKTDYDIAPLTSSAIKNRAHSPNQQAAQPFMAGTFKTASPTEHTKIQAALPKAKPSTASPAAATLPTLY